MEENSIENVETIASKKAVENKNPINNLLFYLQ